MGRGICSKIIKINATMANRAVRKTVRAIIKVNKGIVITAAKAKTVAKANRVIATIAAKAKTVRVIMVNRVIAITVKATVMTTNVRVVFS